MSISDEQVLENARAVSAEIARQIDHQVKATETIDTRSSAVLALTATIAAIVVPVSRFDTPESAFAGAMTGALALAVLVSLVLAIRPRSGFAYGASASALVSSLDKYAPSSLAHSLTESLATARDENERQISAKARWFTTGMVFLVVATIGLATMGWTGALG